MIDGTDLFSVQARELQDEFDTRRLADRIAQHFVRPALSQEQVEFIVSCRMLFMATSDAEGRLDCSYKGGRPGFVEVIDNRTLMIPFYNGNGMFCALGNIIATGRVGLLFIDFESQYRLRVNGVAQVNDPPEGRYPGAVKVVSVESEVVYDLCERYVHRLKFVADSEYCPEDGYQPPPAPYLGKSIYDGARPGERTESGDPVA